MTVIREDEVQKILQKFEAEELTTELFLTEEQKHWLVRAIHIFQAHEKQMRLSASTGDKTFTEAMVRYIMKNFAS